MNNNLKKKLKINRVNAYSSLIKDDEDNFISREEYYSSRSLNDFDVLINEYSEEIKNDLKNEKSKETFKKDYKYKADESNENIKELILKYSKKKNSIKKKKFINKMKNDKYHLKYNEFNESSSIDDKYENIKKKRKKSSKAFSKYVKNYIGVSNIKNNKYNIENETNKHTKINKKSKFINNENTNIEKDKNIYQKEDKNIELSIFNMNDNSYSDNTECNNNYYKSNNIINCSNNDHYDNKCNNNKTKINKIFPAKNMNSFDYIMYEEDVENNINNKLNKKKNRKNNLNYIKDMNEQNKDIYILNNVNINDLNDNNVNKRIEISDVDVNKYNEKSKIDLINNFLKKKKKKKKLKKKNNSGELVDINYEKNYNYIPCNNKKEKRHMNKNNGRNIFNSNLKYEVISGEEKILHESSKSNEKKKGKRMKKYIPMNILDNLNNNEDLFKWRKKYRNMKRLALDETKNKKVHVFVFIIFLFLNIFINYDSGILPISLNKITDDFHLSITLQGLLGSMPYIGLTIASFFLATILQKYEQKKIILKSMLLNTINILLSFFCTNKFFFIFLRFIYGITHSVLIIYFPVWAHEYAPSFNLTFWLGLIHISTIMGITVGYLCTGLLIFFNFSWMYSLLIQAFFLIFFSIFLFIIPKKFINISNISKNPKLNNISKYNIFTNNDNGNDTSTTTDLNDNNTIIIYVSKDNNDFNCLASQKAINFSEDLVYEKNIINTQKLNYIKRVFYKIKKTYFFSSIVAILRCPLYMWLVCSLCNLFFVVIGIFFWSTKFFINYLNIGSLEAMFYFIGTSLTAPVIGILIGSKIVDKFIGGYKEYKNRLRTLYFCIFNSFLTFLLALMICIFDNYKFTLIFTWIILLFGAMLLPPITGIILSTVKSEIRSFASAFSMFMYNIFGYALGTFFPGFIVDFFRVSEVVSIKVVYLWSFFGLINLCIATLFAKKK
ncbi:major facilitator superfamily protein, putative [Plasmodium gallinaceum]|uniref:Major facilitator superfamily protein, putative n=1 Tax=Plasmodium gallinaceum TaxID=5849 RepID=A0A1J1GVB3_PLAGA|nr:major facilitator superfamily protein, putative [Plasmodium gallinaceum]CRG96402.1 major facilitator superfamily protein, putative [Plasmodium gallinaceum]